MVQLLTFIRSLATNDAKGIRTVLKKQVNCYVHFSFDLQSDKLHVTLLESMAFTAYYYLEI